MVIVKAEWGGVSRDLVEFMTQTRGLRTVVEDENSKIRRLRLLIGPPTKKKLG
jgi:nucleoside diphosphate kinase